METLFFNEGSEYTTFEFDDPILNIEKYIKKEGLTKKLKNSQLELVLFSRTTLWNEYKEMQEKDFILAMALSDIANNFDIEHMIDEFCTETITGYGSKYNKLVKILSSVISKPRLIIYYKNLFKNFLEWYLYFGCVPLGYINRDDIQKTAPEISEFISNDQIKKYLQKENFLFKNISKRDFQNKKSSRNQTEEFSSLLNSVHGAGAREVSAIVKALGVNYHEELFFTILQLLKRSTSGPLPYIPTLDFTHMDVVLCLTNERVYVIDKYQNIFETKIITHPRVSKSAAPVGIVKETIKRSKQFRTLYCTFITALENNSKRTLFTTHDLPQAIGKEKTNISEIIDKEKYNFPKALYDSLISQHNLFEQRSNIAAQVSGSHRTVDQTGYSRDTNVMLNSITSRHENMLQTQMYNEFKTQLENLRERANGRDALKKTLTGLYQGNLSQVYKSMQLLEGDEKSAVLSILGKLEKNDGGKDDGVRIEELNPGSRLVQSYGSAITLVDIEELLTMWNTTWEGALSGAFGFVRRKNALQYNSTKQTQIKPEGIVQSAFIETINSCGELIGKMYPINGGSLNFTELLLLLDRVDPWSMRDLISGHIGIKSSSLVFKDDFNTDETISVLNCDKIPEVQNIIYPHTTLQQPQESLENYEKRIM